MTHCAICVWCGLTVETHSHAESAEIITEHVLHCDEGPIKTVLDILDRYASPYVAEKAKDEIRCKLMR
jgi:hypothetical protein